MLLAFICSILLHLLLIFTVADQASRRNLGNVKMKRPEPAPFVFSLTSGPEGRVSPLGTKREQGQRRSFPRSKTIRQLTHSTRRNLQEKLFSAPLVGPTQEKVPEAELADGYESEDQKRLSDHVKKLSGKDGFAVARQMGLKEDALSYRFFKALWGRIHRNLKFPEDLIRTRVEGVVTYEAELTPDGRATGNFRILQADQPLLKALVLITLMEALKEPLELKSDHLPGELIPKSGTVWVNTRFEFKVHLDGLTRDIERTAPLRFKNQLEFYRSGQAVSKLLELYSKIPPIIPIPGGMMLDVIGLIRWIDSLGKPDPELLRARRIEIQREEWDRRIRRNK
jgi:hypothetical protein